MRNKRYLKALAYVLTFGLVTGSVQTNVYAAQLQNKQMESGEISEVTEENEETVVEESEIESQPEMETESQQDNSEEETETESPSEGSEEETEEESTEQESTEGSIVEETEQTTEEESESASVEETTEETEEETTTETVEETTEEAETEIVEETIKESTEEAKALSVTDDGATPESDFTWEGTTIVQYNGTAKEVIIPEKATKIGSNAFKNNQTIESVTISKNITGIGGLAFYCCSNLKEVKIESTKIDRNNGCGLYIFKGCNIGKVEFAEGTTYIPAFLFNYAGFQTGMVIEIPETVTYIGNHAFWDAGNLKGVTFKGNKVTEIGDTAFRGTAIESISLPESLKTISGSAFWGCWKLEEITIPKNVTKIGGLAFYQCSNLKKIKIESTTIDQNNGCGMYIFQGCNIATVEFAEGTTYIPAFMFNSAGFQIGMVIEIPETVTCIGNYAFWDASNLKGVTFKGNKVTEIGDTAFRGTAIESISLPESLKTISGSAFWGCWKLKEITIPKNVTKIGGLAFYQCDNLEKVVIPASVKSIGYSSFPNNSGLKIYAVKNSYAYNWAKANGYTLAECYSITYKLNGGINGAGNPTVYEKGESLSFANASRKGYTFAGWYKDSKFKNAFKYTTDTTGDLTLYAKWNINTYKINYITNGGTLAKNSPATYKITNTVTLKNPTKTGYSFTGWYTDKNCTAENKVKTIKKGTTEDITLYAGWTENTYTIKFAVNGSKVSGKMTNVTGCGYDDKITLAKCPYTRTGYEFVGWNTKANGKGANYADGAVVEKLIAKNKGTVTLYAVWKAVTYEITYHLDGGTNNSKNPATYTSVNTVQLKKPTKTGYTFKGWYTDATFKTKFTTIKKGSTGVKEVYAKWQVNKYKITFNANKGKGKMTALTGCEYDKSYKLPENQFTRKGYTFKGWNTKANGKGVSYTNAEQIKNLTTANGKTITLYAQWEKN